MNHIIITFLGLLLFVGGCDKEPTPAINRGLMGQWEFKKAQGGMTGTQVVLPPANTRIVFRFEAGKVIKKFVNDQLEDQGEYELVEVKSIFTGKPDSAIRFKDFGITGDKIYAIKNDSLFLSDNHVEAFGSLYVRVK